MEYAEFPQSTAVAWAAYVRRRRALYLAYRENMRVYLYRKVPLRAYDELLNAESKGNYVNLHIKPFYRHEEVTTRLNDLGLPPRAISAVTDFERRDYP
jgi:KTSC domain